MSRGIICCSLPAECNNKQILTEHFSQFGDVERVLAVPEKGKAKVVFKSAEDAIVAQQIGNLIDGIEFRIFEAADDRTSQKARTVSSSDTRNTAFKRKSTKSPDNSQIRTDESPAPKRSSISDQPNLGGDAQNICDDDYHPTIATPDAGSPQKRPPLKRFLRRPSLENRRGRVSSPASVPPVSSLTWHKKRTLAAKTVKSNTPFTRANTTEAPLDDHVSEANQREQIVHDVDQVAPPKRHFGTISHPKPFFGSTFSAPQDSVLPTKKISCQDKIDWLKKRDDSMRKQFQQKNLENTADIIGTCDDMCPELERYVREATSCTDVWEMTDGVADHHRFVKEYTRSSADKENPLPHELRSVAGLQRTMKFLMIEVMNKCPEEVTEKAVWFNFLWNRTRSIRNDITIQNLHTPATVDLVEKCTRFHIVCAYELCDLSIMDGFDKTVNHEHFQKSMQTLKHMYYDLAKDGLSCPNQGEFRGYDLMINLNQGSVLLDASSLPDDVWKHPEMILAVKIHKAHCCQNYVRLLKLLRSASYLSSCILHRYLNSWRISAVKALAGCCSSIAPNSYSFERLREMLCFESEQEVIAFFEHFDFEINEADEAVVLTRISVEDIFVPTDKEPLISNKAEAAPLGDRVNNAELPRQMEEHQLTDSFENVNFDSVAAREPSAGSPDVNDSVLREVAQDVLEEEIHRQMCALVSEVRHKMAVYFEGLEEFLMQIVDEIVEEETPTVISNVNQDIALEHFTHILDKSHEFVSPILDETVSSEISGIIDEVMSTELKERRAHQLQIISADLIEEIVSDSVKMLTQGICEEVFDSDVIAVLRQMSLFEKRRVLNLKRRTMRGWKSVTDSIMKKRRFRKSFPAEGSSLHCEGLPRFCPDMSARLDACFLMAGLMKNLSSVITEELLRPIPTDALMSHVPQTFVHLAVVDLSRDESQKMWLNAKLSGHDFLNLGIPNLLRSERSYSGSSFCIHILEVGNFLSEIEDCQPSALLIFDPENTFDDKWLAEAANSIEIIYATNRETVETVNHVSLNWESSAGVTQSGDRLTCAVNSAIVRAVDRRPLPSVFDLKQVLLDVLKTCFFLNISQYREPRYRNILSARIIVELYVSIFDQFVSFMEEHLAEFPMIVFKTVTKDLNLGELLEYLSNFAFPVNSLNQAGSVSGWHEAIIIVEMLLEELPASPLKHDLAVSVQELLHNSSSISDDGLFEDCSEFPWMEISLLSIDYIVGYCGHLPERNICCYSDPIENFKFCPPPSWRNFVREAYELRRHTPIVVHGITILPC